MAWPLELWTILKDRTLDLNIGFVWSKILNDVPLATVDFQVPTDFGLFRAAVIAQTAPERLLPGVDQHVPSHTRGQELLSANRAVGPVHLFGLVERVDEARHQGDHGHRHSGQAGRRGQGQTRGEVEAGGGIGKAVVEFGLNWGRSVAAGLKTEKKREHVERCPCHRKNCHGFLFLCTKYFHFNSFLSFSQVYGG